MATISILRARSYSDIYGVVKRGLAMIDHSGFSPSDSVVIKPNLCDVQSAEAGATTSPALVRAMIRILKESDVKDIAIIESDHQGATADQCFERLGYSDLAEQLGVQTVNLSTEPTVRIEFDGFFLKEFDLPEIFLQCTKFISMPKIKTHATPRLWRQGMTCAMKNQFGVIPQRYKSKYHPFLPEILADLNALFRPDTIVVDGIVAMEGLGPGAGKPKRLGLVLVGDDPISVDTVVAKLMGFSPSAVPFLRFCFKKGLAPRDMEIFGEKLEDVKKSFDLPRRTWRQSFFQAMGAKLARSAYKTSNALDRLSLLSAQASNASVSDMLRYLLRLKKRSS